MAYSGQDSVPRSGTVAAHVLRQGAVTLVLASPLVDSFPEDMSVHLMKHGDGVRDVAFSVDDCRGIFAEAMKRGAVAVREPTKVEDEHGHVWIATVRTYGDTLHSFVESAAYKVRRKSWGLFGRFSCPFAQKNKNRRGSFSPGIRASRTRIRWCI